MKTKRFTKLTAWLLTMVMLITLMPSFTLTASAEQFSGELVVLGVDLVNGDDDHAITCGSGSAVYDPETQTLTLTNATIEEPSATGRSAGIYIDGFTEPVTIILVGENSITLTDTAYDNNGIWNDASVNLKLSGEGSLNVTTYNDYSPFGIWNRYGSVFVEDATLNFSLADGSNTNGYLVDTNSSISFDNASVTATDYAVMFVSGNITVKNNSNLNLSLLENAMFTDEDITIENSTVFAETEYYATISAWGDIHITDSTVTANSVDANGIYCYGLVTVSGGTATITSDGNDAFRANGGITITDDAAVTAEGYYAGVYTNEILNVESGTLKATGGDWAILATRVSENEETNKPTDSPAAIVLGAGFTEKSGATISTEDWEYTPVWDDADWEYYDKWQSRSYFVDGENTTVTSVELSGPTIYTVTFDANGGSVTPASATTDASGSCKLTTLPTPTRLGYTFLGWFDSAAGGNAVTTDKEYTEDTTIYAQWRVAYWTDMGNYDISWYDPNGISFTISTAEQLAGVAVLVNGMNGVSATDFTHPQFTGMPQTILLDKDINLSGKLWTPIGTTINGDKHTFKGVLTGQNHSISNMSVSASEAKEAGLFGNLGGSAQVRDFAVTDMEILCDSTVTDNVNGYSGGIAATASDSALILNCRTSGKVQAEYTAGGIVGDLSSSASVQKCYNEAEVLGIGWSSDGKRNQSNAGGIAGTMNGGTVKNCYNLGEVSSTADTNDRAGGITANLAVGSLSNAYNMGNVTGNSDYVGSITAYVSPSYYGTSLSNCYYLLLSGTETVGIYSAASDFKEKAIKKDAAAFASGEVAYLLNGSVSGGTTWYQNLDNENTGDDYPTFVGGKVYKVSTYAACGKNDTPVVSYSNTDKGDVAPEHLYQYTADGAVITESCRNCNTHSETATLKLDTSAELVYSPGMEKKPASVEYSDGWMGDILTVYYENNVNAGTNTAKASVSKEGAVAELYFSIAKAVPDYTLPTLTAVYGETLADVKGLTSEFNFVEDSTTPVGNAGVNSFYVKFTPDDDNYFEVDNIPVTVSVTQKSIEDATYDDFAPMFYDGSEKTPVATVTVDGLTVTGSWSNVKNVSDTTTFTASGNYTGKIETVSSGMQPKEIGISWSDTEFIYDKTAHKPTATATGLVTGDSCTITVSGEQTNAGESYTATAESLSNTNYKLPESKTITFSIAKRTVTITEVAIEATKVYDRETTAAITNFGTVSNVVSGDDVIVNNASAAANYTDKNVGIGKTVIFTGFAISGNDVTNYMLSSQPASKTADITPCPVTITGVEINGSKVYDGNTDATITNNGAVIGVISGDTVTVDSASAAAAYADANVGTDKAVTFSGFAISGVDAANYALSAQPADATANITAKDIASAEITLGDSLTYNGEEQTRDFTVAQLDGLDVTYDTTGDKATYVKADGNYTLTVTGTGNFTGSASKEWNIAMATPVASEENPPAAEKIKKGALLSKSELSGEMTGAGGAVLDGTLSWKDGEKKMSEKGTFSETAVFTPADTVNYETVEIPVSVTVYTANAPSAGTGASLVTGGTTPGTDTKDPEAEKPDTDTPGGDTPAGDAPSVNTETEEDGTVKADITAPEGEETRVEIPVENPDAVTRVTVVDEDGNETEITDFEVTEKGIAISVSGDCTVSVAGGGVPDSPSKKIFEDVHPESHWAVENVDYAYANGLMNGVSEDMFAPDSPLTRAMLVTILYRAEGAPATNRSIPFADVDMSAYYANAVVWGQQNGIIKGYSETEFRPDEEIIREQIAAIMHRYAQYKGYDVSVGESTNILSYADADSISEYAIPSMQYAVGSGLLKGRTEATLNPKDTATRAESAAILHRFMEANK